ncbi:hypothetical protein Tco_1262609 [Tanacetum coccineum]
MELYMQNKEHARRILESVEHGPLIWPTIEENGMTKTKKYEELSTTKKIRADCDLKATNIILQGLPTDVYSLINHHRVAKDLWERVQLLMQVNQQTHMAKFPQIDSGLAVPLRNSSNPRQQATIYDGRVTVQPVQGRQSLFSAGTSGTRANISGIGSSKVLNDEELEFLADPGVVKGPVTQTVITHNAAYQANDLDAYDSDYDDFSIAKAVLMANLSSYRSDVISKVNKANLLANESLSAELERYKERVKLLEERKNVHLSTREKLIMDDIIREKNAQSADFEKEINYLKQTLSEQSKEKELLTKTFNVLKNESKEKEAKNIDKEISLKKKVKELDNIVGKIGQSTQTVHMLTKRQVFYDNNLKQAFGFQNPFYLKKAQQIRPMINDGSVIAKETNYHVDKQCFAIQKKQLLIKNDRLLDQIISYDIVNIFMNSSMDVNTSVNVNSSVAMNDSVNYVEMCNKCLELEAELIKQHNMVKKDEYNKLSKRFYELEQHCISLEIAMQLNKEIFQKNNTFVNQTEPSFDQLFELNNLKAELQVKDTTIEKLKENIKRLNKTSTTNSVKKVIDEIETINIELEHRVTKLIAENEKQTYKHLYDSIKPSHVCAKEHADSLVDLLNQKSVEITDLNAQL